MCLKQSSQMKSSFLISLSQIFLITHLLTGGQGMLKLLYRHIFHGLWSTDRFLWWRVSKANGKCFCYLSMSANDWKLCFSWDVCFTHINSCTSSLNSDFFVTNIDISKLSSYKKYRFCQLFTHINLQRGCTWSKNTT